MSEENTPQNKPSLRLSLSKAKTYTDCQKKYNFAYNLKLPRKDRDYHTLGKMAHRVLELFHLEYLEGSIRPYNIAMNAAFKSAFAEFKKELTALSKAEVIEMIDKYLQKIYTDPLLLKDVLSVEKNFSFNISENVILNGMIDKIQIDPDGIINVCDYKTTKNKKYLKNDFLQLLTYAYVVYQENPDVKKIRGSYILLRHDFEKITKDFSIDEILEIKGKYEAYAKSIEDEKLWRANPTRLCSYCEFLEHCDEGKVIANNTFAGANINGPVAW